MSFLSVDSLFTHLAGDATERADAPQRRADDVSIHASPRDATGSVFVVCWLRHVVSIHAPKRAES